jgi:hypothetical protein
MAGKAFLCFNVGQSGFAGGGPVSKGIDPVCSARANKLTFDA